MFFEFEVRSDAFIAFRDGREGVVVQTKAVILLVHYAPEAESG